MQIQLAAVQRAAILTLCAAAAAGCAKTPTNAIVPVPAGAIAVAALQNDRVAVLAGNDDAKNVSIVDFSDAVVVKSFGVTKEALGIASNDSGDALLIAVGGVNHNRPFGAVERWRLDGAKDRVVPLPARPEALTQVIDGVSYVLLKGKGNARAALSLKASTMQLGRPLPLEAGARDMQQCRIGARPYLVYVYGRDVIVVRGLESSMVLRTDIPDASPQCGDNSHVYAIARGFATRSLTVLSLPSLTQAAQIPLPGNASKLYTLHDGQVISLNSTPTSANIQTVDTAPVAAGSR